MKNSLLNPLYVCLLLSVSAFGADSKFVKLTNKSGRTIKVYLQSATGTEVKVKLLSNRKLHTLKISSLDHVSQQKVEDWNKDGGGNSTDLKITYTSGKSSRTSKVEQYDDKTLKLRPKVSIKNEDHSAAAKDLSVTVMLLGTPVNDKSLYYVFVKDTKKADQIAAGESFVSEYRGVKADFDDSGTAKYGAKYHGYVIFVQDANGEIIASKSIPSTLIKKYGKKFLKLKEKKSYNRELQEADFSIRSHSNY